jgi:integrase
VNFTQIVKFSDSYVTSLKPRPVRYEVEDRVVHGLRVRVSPSGHRSYSVLYRRRGNAKLMRYTLRGGVGAWSIEQARQRAREVIQATDAATVAAGPTFRELRTAFLDSRRHLRTYDQNERYLDILEDWKNVAASAITAADIRAVLAIQKPIASNRMRTLLSTMFTWAIRQGLVTDNPVAATSPIGIERTRDRWLREDELRALWIALDDEPAQVQGYFKALLLTACRKSEVALFSPLEIEGDNWIIPGRRVKNGLDHLIPLSPDLRGYLAAVRPFRAQDTMKRLARKAGLINVRIHDTRRTVETHLARLGVLPHIRDRILNHAPRGVGAVHYDRHDYASEKAAALRLWEQDLMRIVGANVIAFPVPQAS